MKPFTSKLISAAFVSTALLAAPAHSQVVFSDSFESADLSASHTTGLDWARPNRTSLVTRDSDLGDMVLYNGNPVEILVGYDREWAAIDGNIAMRFRYPSGSNSMSEQRFDLDAAHPELWISFWLKVPINYRHSSNSPSNSKLFAIWMDGYEGSGNGPTVVWEFWNDGSGGSNVAYRYVNSERYTGHQQHTQFIRHPDDQGRWMQVAMHIKAATSSSANDGIIQFYRRWSNESSFSLLHNDQNANIAAPSGGPFGWKTGYLMGWSNPGYAEDTEFLLDNFVVSRTSLVGDAEPIPSPDDPKPGPDDPNSCMQPQIPNILTWNRPSPLSLLRLVAGAA